MLSLISQADTRQPYKMLPDKITRYSMINKTYKQAAPLAKTYLCLGLGAILAGAICQKATMMLGSLVCSFGGGKNCIDTYLACNPAFKEIKARAERIKNIRESKSIQ